MGTSCSTYQRAANAHDAAADTRGTTTSSSVNYSGTGESDPHMPRGDGADRRRLRITVSARTTSPQQPPAAAVHNDARCTVVSNPLCIDDRQVEPKVFTLDKCSGSVEVVEGGDASARSAPKSVVEANIEMILQRTRSGIALDESGIFTAEAACPPSRTPKDGNLIGSVAARLDSLASTAGRKSGAASPAVDVFALPRYRSPRNQSRTKQHFAHVSATMSSFSPQASFPDANSTRLEPLVSSLDVPADCDVAWAVADLEATDQGQKSAVSARRATPRVAVDEDEASQGVSEAR